MQLLCTQGEISAHTHTKIDAVTAMPKSIMKHAIRYIMCIIFSHINKTYVIMCGQVPIKRQLHVSTSLNLPETSVCGKNDPED